MAELTCIKGEVALVDEADLEKVAPYGWYPVQTSRKSGKPKIYVMGTRVGDGVPPVYLHRLVMDAPKGVLVDHRDGNTFDCRKHNLRLATHGQNAHNRMPNGSMGGRPCASQYKGVSLERKGKKWRAQIGYLSVIHRIGVFKTEIEAAEAYDDFSYKLHGEFGYRNFPARQPAEISDEKVPRTHRRAA